MGRKGGCVLYTKLRSIHLFKGLNKGCVLYTGASYTRENTVVTICLTFNNHHSIKTIPPLLSVTLSTIYLSAHPSQLFYILPLFPQIKISKLFLSMTPVHLLSTDHMWPVYSHDIQLLWQLRNLILLTLA